MDSSIYKYFLFSIIELLIILVSVIVFYFSQPTQKYQSKVIYLLTLIVKDWL